MWRHFLLVLVFAALPCALGQSAPAKDQDQGPSAGPQGNQAPPRSEPMPVPRGPGDSSSRDTDLEAPPSERSAPDDSVIELHSWDPHQAMKDVEVGDFYRKQQNYRAALSRYCEALSYKPNDAVATFRIGESLEKAGDLAGAQAYYEAYLKILPAGPFAGQCRKSLERLKALPERPNKHLAQRQGCEPLGKPVRARPEPYDPDRPVLTRNPTSPASGKSQ